MVTTVITATVSKTSYVSIQMMKEIQINSNLLEIIHVDNKINRY